MERNRKILDKIILVLVCITIFVSSVFIGSPVSNNANILTVLALFVFIFYYIIEKFIIKDFRLIKNKIDIGMFALFTATFIPLLFGTYKDLNSEITYIFKYLTAFCVYILIRDILERDKRYASYIINCIIFSSVFIALTGIDNMTTNWFSTISEILGNPITSNLENRMLGIIGYENAFGILMAINILLCIGEYLKSDNSNKKIKNLYFACSYIFISATLLSYSRITFLVFIFVMVMYIVLLNDKNKIIDCVKLLITNMILGILFALFYQKEINVLNTNYVAWIFFIIIFIISYILSYIYNFVSNKLYNISIKTYIIVGIAVFIGLLLTVVVGLNLEKPLRLFETSNSSNNVKYVIQNIDGCKYYNFSFDLQSESDRENIYSIEIIEENKYYDTICSHEIKFGSFEGIKTIGFKADRETVEVSLIFKSSDTQYNKGLTVNNLEINGERYILNYAYLPEKLVTKIKSINISNRGFWERGVFYQDAIKIIKDNWIFGLGGNGWMHSYKMIQTYNYDTIEIHSYPLQVFLEYGIIGFLSLIYLVMIFIYLIVKKIFINKEKLNVLQISIICSILLMFIHSIFDFEMSFMHIMYICAILLSIFSIIIDNKEKTIIIDKFNIILQKILSTILLIGCLISICFNSIDFFGKMYLLNSKNIDLKIIRTLSKLVPYNREYIATIVNFSDNKNANWNEDVNQLLSLDKGINVEKNCKNILENLRTNQTMTKELVDYILNGLTNLKYSVDCDLILFQNEQLDKFCKEINGVTEYDDNIYIASKYIVDNYEINKQKIMDADKSRLNKKEIEKLIKRLDNIYSEAAKKVQKYEQ